jgi:hypothetical protein
MPHESTAPGTVRRDVDIATLKAIVDRTKAVLEPNEHALLKDAVDTLAYVTRELESSKVNLVRLRRFLFGESEKTKKVLGAAAAPPAPAPNEPMDPASVTPDAVVQPAQPEPEPEKQKQKQKKPGHGRHGPDAYPGARKKKVPHPDLHHGDRCPSCHGGTVYGLKEPRCAVRITAVAPIQATVWQLEELRCGTCNEYFTAPAPPEVGPEKYDASVAAMVAELKYGIGVPFNRIQKLQHDMGIPLPAATQWELVDKAANQLFPIFQELVRQGAVGDVLHNDDTSMRILELSPEERGALLGPGTEDRSGVFTSGIVSVSEGHRVALYYTGPRHSGENVATLIEKRSATLPPPIQMCDASASNTSGDFETILAACLAHGRRYFVDVATTFPGECRFVLEKLREVYKNDAVAKKNGLSPSDRLAFHQTNSGPLMDELSSWLVDQIDSHKVEENSALGQAIQYMRKHWVKLTLFLRQEGAPLDNNICERALKKAILHRKNSLFFKTLHGAAVGDLFMSFIHTAEMNGVSGFAYLVALLRNTVDACRRPADWMPWCYPRA